MRFIRPFLGAAFICVAVIPVFLFGCKEKPDVITANVMAPEPFSLGYYDEDGNGTSAGPWLPPLRIAFDAGSVSPANIDLIDSVIVSGASIHPEMPGKWRWEGEYNIYFEPETEWPAGTEYTVKLAPSVFNKEAAGGKTRTYKFKTAPLEAYVIDSKISRAPGERRTPRFSAGIGFNYNVDPAVFERHSKLTLDGADVSCSVSWDNATKSVTIVSEPVQITDREQKFLFEASGFVSADSPYKYTEKLRASAVVPALSSFFNVRGISAEIVRDGKNQPQQIVTVEFSAEASEKDVKDALSVKLLPKYIYEDGTLSDTPPYGKPEASSHRWTYEDLEKYPSAGKTYDFIPAAADGLPETTHPFIVDIDDDSERYMAVAVKPGFISKDGFPLSRGVTQIVRVPKYPKEIYIMSDGAILPVKNDNVITVASRGVKTIYTEVGKVLDYQLHNVIGATYSGGLSEPDFRYDGIDESNFMSLSSGRGDISYKSNKDVSYSYIDLGKFAKKSGPGLYYVSVEGGGNKVKRLILVTDMGMILKKNADGSSSVFVMSISKGEPVRGVRVEVTGKNGLPVIYGYTDGDGLFSFEDLKSLPRDKKPVAVSAYAGGDVSFIPLDKYSRQVNYSNFDTGGVYEGESADGMNAYIFTDRGIYRPGDTARISGIVKQSDWSSLEGVPVEAVIKDGDENDVLVKRFSLNGEGIFEFDFKTINTTRTGVYSAELYSLDGRSRDGMIGSAVFRVDEFEADTMRVNARINGKSADGWQKPEKVSGMVRAENMFGTPAQGRTVRWSVNVAPAGFYFSRFKDYSFTDPNAGAEGRVNRRFNIEIPDGVTDENGEATAEFGLDAFDGGTYSVSVLAQVFEPGSGDGSAAYDSAMISPLDMIVGYKAYGNLSFIHRGSDQKVNFIAVDKGASPINADGLKIRIFSVKYVSSLVKDGSGGYSYQSVKKTDMISEEPFSISSSGTDYSVPSKNAGQYVIEISGDGKALCRVPFFVSGESNVAGGIDKNAELILRLDKKQYSPGEDIKISIVAPYTGAGLITVEQDRVYAYKWFKADTPSSVQTITLPEGLEGSGYINVSFIRGYDSREIFVNPHSYAVVPFSVNLDSRRINVSVSAPDKAAPGDEIKISYEADGDGKIILYGADEGILQAAGYKLPDPLAFFFKKRALEVDTFQTVDLILPDYRILMDSMAPGGGEAALAAGLNPFARKTDKPAVFWSGIKNVKKGEKYEYIYRIPDYFNGNLKIMAVAASEHAVGSGTSSVISRAPVVLIPNAPFAAAAGDAFDVSLGISNLIEGSGEDAVIKITAETSENLETEGNGSVEISVPEGAERTVSFRVKVLDDPGKGEIRFKAENAALEKPVAASATLSVRPPAIFSSRLDIGRFDGADHTVSGIFRNMYNHYARRVFSVSSNPLAALAGAEGYLKDYPHKCTEQITSGIFPLIYLASGSDGAYLTFDEAAKRIKEGLDVLRPRQTDGGGFSLWPDRKGVSPYSTVYLMHMLTDAKERGFSVPGDITAGGLKWLGEYAAGEPEGLWDARVKAYAVYVMARNGIVVSRYIGRLEEYLNSVYPKDWKKDLISAYLGASYIIMRENDKGLAYMKFFEPEGDGFVFYRDYDSSSVRNANYLYLIANHAPEMLPEYKKLAEGMIKSVSEGNYNTLSSSAFIVALGAAGQAAADDEGVSVSAVGKDGAKAGLEIRFTPFPTADFGPDTDKLEVSFPGKASSGYFYYVLQSGFDRVSPPAVSNGLELTREYLDKDGEKITKAAVGDEITVRIRLRASGGNGYGLTAVTDLLPGGFEIIRESVNARDLEYFDIREDRALFYVPASGKSAEITYKAKLLSSGDFTVPPAYAEGMYNRLLNANTASGRLIVNSAGTNAGDK